MSDKKIISASRRTDIPAFYTSCFINRIQAGYCFYPKCGVSYNIEAYTDILHWIAEEAANRNLRIESCAEPSLNVPGIVPGRCVDGHLLKKIGKEMESTFSLHKQRERCLCHHYSVDIGVNNSCGFGCRYCYATAHHDRAREMITRHNPEWSCISQDVSIDENVRESI